MYNFGRFASGLFIHKFQYLAENELLKELRTFNQKVSDALGKEHDITVTTKHMIAQVLLGQGQNNKDSKESSYLNTWKSFVEENMRCVGNEGAYITHDCDVISGSLSVSKV